MGAFDGFLEALEEELEVFAALDEVDVGGVDDEEIGGGVAEEEMFVGAREIERLIFCNVSHDCLGQENPGRPEQ